MSINLGLKGIDPVSGEILDIPLVQTSTEETYKLLDKGSADDILEAYLLYVKDRLYDVSHLEPRNPYERDQIQMITAEFDELSKELRSLKNKQFYMM